MDLSKCKPGDKLQLRNGDVVTVDIYSDLCCFSKNVPYPICVTDNAGRNTRRTVNGLCIDGSERPEDVVKILGLCTVPSKELKERFSKTVLVIEATEFEKEIISNRYEDKTNWQAVYSGFKIFIRDRDKEIHVNLSWAVINDKYVCFYTPSGVYVNYELINEWFNEFLVDIPRINVATVSERTWSTLLFPLDNIL